MSSTETYVGFCVPALASPACLGTSRGDWKFALWRPTAAAAMARECRAFRAGTSCDILATKCGNRLQFASASDGVYCRAAVPGCSEKAQMGEIHGDLAALAEHLSDRREALLLAWQRAVKRDPALTDGEALPRAKLYDHIPAMLTAFERGLRQAAADPGDVTEGARLESGAAHGLQRWQQGYDLREVTRELGKLNECVLLELDHYAKALPRVSLDAMTRARQIWASLCSSGIEESVSQYFCLQQREAAGHVKDLESALSEIQELEKQRADLWQQAAHDLRGNLGVVANATVGLAHGALHQSSRDDFVRILMRNVTTLHHLLDDVTSLARLEA